MTAFSLLVAIVPLWRTRGDAGDGGAEDAGATEGISAEQAPAN